MVGGNQLCYLVIDFDMVEGTVIDPSKISRRSRYGAGVARVSVMSGMTRRGNRKCIRFGLSSD